jgi:hypothetical protein
MHRGGVATGYTAGAEMRAPNRAVRAALLAVCAASVAAAVAPAAPVIQVKAQLPADIPPPWSKGIVPVTPESYYNAIACGQQGGANPPCVFWDTGLCRNDDFELAFYTGYKAVAYEVWQAVRQKRPAPKPDYGQAQRTKVTIGVTPVRGSTNTITDLVLKRGGRIVAPIDRSAADGGRRFTFDYPAFAPTAGITLDLVGKTRTISCRIDQTILARLR